MAWHHHDISAPVTPIPSTTANTRPPSSNFRNRFSNASLLSLSSVRSLLPQYSGGPTTETTTDSTPSSWNSPSAIEPPQYSLLNPHHLPMLPSSTATRFEIGGDSHAHEFRYSYPIRPKNPWATLHLHTRNTITGSHLKSLQSQPRLPRFWSCDPITGTVQLDLDTPQNIQLISITVRYHFVLR